MDLGEYPLNANAVIIQIAACLFSQSHFVTLWCRPVTVGGRNRNSGQEGCRSVAHAVRHLHVERPELVEPSVIGREQSGPVPRQHRQRLQPVLRVQPACQSPICQSRAPFVEQSFVHEVERSHRQRRRSACPPPPLAPLKHHTAAWLPNISLAASREFRMHNG